MPCRPMFGKRLRYLKRQYWFKQNPVKVNQSQSQSKLRLIMSQKSEWEKYAKALPATEWIRRIKTIPVENRDARIKVAGIIWWDYNDSSKAWASFRSIPNQWKNDGDLNLDSLVEALCLVGYPKEIAHERALCSRLASSDEIQLDGGTGYPSTSSRRNQGAGAVLLAMYEQAVEDIKSLIASGVIVNGKIAANWPAPKSNGVVGYTSRNEVAQLIQWISNTDTNKFMKELGINSDMSEVLISIGFANAKHQKASKVA